MRNTMIKKKRDKIIEDFRNLNQKITYFFYIEKEVRMHTKKNKKKIHNQVVETVLNL